MQRGACYLMSPPLLHHLVNVLAALMLAPGTMVLATCRQAIAVPYIISNCWRLLHQQRLHCQVCCYLQYKQRLVFVPSMTCILQGLPAY